MTATPTTGPAGPAGPSASARTPLSGPEKRSIGGMTGFVLLLHVLGWGVLAVFVTPA